MKAVIDKFQGQLSDYFRQLLLAVAYLRIGEREISRLAPGASIQLTLDKDITTEPLYLSELLPYSRSVSDGILELYQGKMIARWSDLLNALFIYLVNSHFNGIRNFSELKKRTARIDFSLNVNLQEQVTESLISEYSFQRYADRIKLINSVLNPDNKYESELMQIRKHILIRNSVQHHESLVYTDMLKELGSSKLTILDENADQKELLEHERIILYIPELDALKRALFLVSNEWRRHHV